VFIIDREYSRANDIHARYGGQRQGGISTPANFPLVFLFTGAGGEQYGYKDGWVGSETFVFTGEGQVGDMTFRVGNRAIRDHARNEKQLMLFESLGHGRPVRYRGMFTCSAWESFRGPDRNGDDRECIRFHLVKNQPSMEFIASGGNEPEVGGQDLAELRKRAYGALAPSRSSKPADAAQTYRQRSKAVRDYVLARANGVCELSGEAGPFITRRGAPYLEVHHTHLLADDGPDHPRWVAAIDPTLHREIHFGQNGPALNALLMERLAEIEPAGE
tara:strand:+ start:4485 stop:5306 length:822 start_codon:yes stop_codon:yes gene_type:complete